MASTDKNLNHFEKELSSSFGGKKIGIVVAEWNQEITNQLYKGCVDFLKSHGVWEKDINTLWVPGSFELTFGAQKLAQKTHNAIICLGCIIKGETNHDEFIAHAVAQGLTNLTIQQKIPFIFGVITVNNLQQAKDRSGGKLGNKGVEAAYTALRLCS